MARIDAKASWRKEGQEVWDQVSLCLLFLIEAKLLCYEREVGCHQILIRIQQRRSQREDCDHVVALQRRYPVSTPRAHCIRGKGHKSIVCTSYESAGTGRNVIPDRVARKSLLRLSMSFASEAVGLVVNLM